MPGSPRPFRRYSDALMAENQAANGHTVTCALSIYTILL